MSFNSWLQNLRSALPPGRGQHQHRRRGSQRATTHRLNLEVLEDRCVPALYAVTDLGTLGGDYSYAFDLNQAGQVVGDAHTADGFYHAFLWDHGSMIDLGTLGGSASSARGINDLGQVVGSAHLPGNATSHAFLVSPQGGVWNQDSDLDGRNDFMIDLGELPGGGYSDAQDINNAGQVAGASGDRAFVWDAANGMTDLGVPPGFMFSWGSGINELGQVTGVTRYEGSLAADFLSAFLWDAANGMTLLGAGSGYTDSSATAINDAGQVVGVQWNAANQIDPAFLWTPDSPNGLSGSFTDLGMLPGGIDSSAAALNNAGQVVGTSSVDNGWDYYPHAFLWDAAGGMVDLQYQLLPGSDATLLLAEAINDGGTIAVNGYNSSWVDRAYLLTPLSPDTPLISIADAPAVTEGNAGTRAATFTVTLSVASTQPVTVAYATVIGTAGSIYWATAGSDYQAASGTLTFAPGETSKPITVQVIGDRLAEPNETFVVILSSPTNAYITDGGGVVTIMDDEPRISIGDVSKSEGRNGKTLFTFTVTLTVPGSSLGYDQAVSMSFQTVNGTAKSGDDYTTKTGTLTFAAYETTKTITIEVKGDSKKEANEKFYLDLSGLSSNALFTKNRGLGTILNDD